MTPPPEGHVDGPKLTSKRNTKLTASSVLQVIRPPEAMADWLWGSGYYPAPVPRLALTTDPDRRARTAGYVEVGRLVVVRPS